MIANFQDEFSNPHLLSSSHYGVPLSYCIRVDLFDQKNILNGWYIPRRGHKKYCVASVLLFLGLSALWDARYHIRSKHLYEDAFNVRN